MKERLTGAIILVALIVVLVPELLSGPVRPAARARGPAPSAEEPPLRSYTIDLADEAHGGSGELRPQPSSSPSQAAPAEPAAVAPPAPTDATVATEQTSPARMPPASATTPATPPPTPPPANGPAATVSPVSAPPVTPPPAATARTASTAATAWMVQLGSFASRSNADGLAQHVHTLGFPVVVSRDTTGRRLYRVQVGPAHDRAGAEQILSKLRAQGQKGTVVRK